VQDKQVMSKGKKGVKSGGKKALVYLKKEDKIEFI
jgi:ribosomal protein L23